MQTQMLLKLMQIQIGDATDNILCCFNIKSILLTPIRVKYSAAMVEKRGVSNMIIWAMRTVKRTKKSILPNFVNAILTFP